MEQLVDLLLDLRPEVAYAIRLVIAVLVTIHVLLTKREIGSSVAWIGLVWLSPFLGGTLYFIFGINRVRRRARTMLSGLDPRRRRQDKAPDTPEDAHLRPLHRGIGAITKRPVEPANSVAIYHNGDQAYPAMLAAIAGASASIGLSIGCGWVFWPAYKAMRKAGIPAGRFMHSFLPWRTSFLNLRTHRKILIIDGVLAFIGGINIADENVLASNPKEPVQDTHFALRGPVVPQLAEVFAEDWQFLTEEDLTGPAWFAPQSAAGEAAARVVSAGPDQDIDKIESAVLQAIACARDSIRVMTPYFLPDQLILSALSLAAMRGVHVEVIVPEQGNHRIIDWATRAHVGALITNGCHVMRSPLPFRHSKLFVIDGEWSLIGSSNWDIRSFRLNFEIGVEVYDRDLAARLERQMIENQGRPLTLDELNSASLVIRLRNAAARLLQPYL